MYIYIYYYILGGSPLGNQMRKGFVVALVLASGFSKRMASAATTGGLSAAATALVDARLSPRTPISCPPGLNCIDDGYLCQAEMLRTSSERLGGRVGWKAGATNAGAQAAMGFGPFLGPLFGFCVEQNGSVVSKSKLGAAFRANEAEFCYFMAQSCPPKESGDVYTEEEVWERVGSIAPAIELAATRCTDSPLSPQAVLADFALNGCVILGERVDKSKFSSSKSVIDATATLKVNSVAVARDKGANVLGNPLTSLTWLVNELNARKLPFLLEGEMVMTGAAAASKSLSVGDTLEACFSGDGMGEQTVIITVIE